MTNRLLLILLVVSALSIAFTKTLVAANSDIFPPEQAAQSSINWKDGYFWIKGKPAFITSGEMHYARIPRELWRDRIWRAKEMGFNCIQTYVFWNASEPKEGQWDFTDNLDLDAWLTAIQDEGMYAVVRVGPYSCAEWDQGGFPAWLTVKPDMTLRDTGAEFDKYAYPHLDEVEKIVAKHQINHGGNVIMVQLENEHPRGWGTDAKDPYLSHLVDQARGNGLEVPVFLSGLHHGNDPAGDSPFTPGNSPWYSTEFWTGWIGKYGNMDTGMLEQKIACTWKIIGFGGAGYDYYVVHGGTNFGYSGCSHETSYDYAAPISETGRFNNFYAPAKRAAYFAQSFSDLLTGSHNDSDLASVDNHPLRLSIRTHPTLGSLIILDRFAKQKGGGQIAPSASAYQSQEAQRMDTQTAKLNVGGMTLPHQAQLGVNTLEPSMILLNIPWTAHASFESVCTNVLLRKTLGRTDYWICYGDPGTTGEVTLKRDGSSPTTTTFAYPTGDTVTEIDLDSGDQQHAKLLVMNKALTDRTWLVKEKIVIGPTFVLEDGTMEFPLVGGAATVYSEGGKTTLTQAAVLAPQVPELSDWSWRDAAPERSGEVKPDEWSHTMGPQPIGAVYSYQNRYAWYRTSLHAEAAKSLSLHIQGGSDPNVTFLNGQASSLDKLNLSSGDNTLAVLVKAEPRPTLYNRVGWVGMPLKRGLWGGVSLAASGTPLDVAWKTWKASVQPGNAEDVSSPQYDASSWDSVDDGGMEDVAHNRRWLRGTFTLSKDQLDSFIEAPDFEKWKSSLYLNGHRLLSFEQNISKLLTTGTNVVVLQVQDTKANLSNLKLDLWRNAPLTHEDWYFHGGLAGLDETAIIGRVTNWDHFLTAEPWQKADEAVAGLPAFWKSTFTYQPDPATHIKLGLSTDGLRAGNAWLNGHNLGECPQKDPVYLPECWLKPGENDLVIFDLYGNRPDKIGITRYVASSVLSPNNP